MRLLLALLLCSCISFQKTLPKSTSVTLDASGVVCETSATCPDGEACVDGVCGRTGCDADRVCRNACCDHGTCVRIDGCTGQLACSHGVCPERCDAAHGGAGCREGCCDGAGGRCFSGVTDSACGTPQVQCRACRNGHCESGVCACGTCGPGAVCTDTGCADCATQPCSGTTPVCDSSVTHNCQPCTTAPSVCADYCQDDGSCGAQPLSDAACVRKDGTRPFVLANGSCGCDATHLCPAQQYCGGGQCLPRTACDAQGNCLQERDETCTDNAECASGACNCADAACSEKRCGPTLCTVCGYRAVGGSGCTGVLNANQVCASGYVCDGNGPDAANCRAQDGVACSADAACLSGSCWCADPNCSGRVCMPVGAGCAPCQYNSDATPACEGFIAPNQTTGPCGGGNVCDGAGGCQNPGVCNCSCVGPTCHMRKTGCTVGASRITTSGLCEDDPNSIDQPVCTLRTCTCECRF